MSSLDRYAKQILFSQIGKQGQEQLLASSVAIFGCGASGTVLANNLCRAGIGRLLLVDRDYVELDNLQRQVLFDENDVAQRLPKSIAAMKKLHQVNSDVIVEAVVADINSENIESLVESVDLILDAVDNFETRYLLNEACVKHQRPWIYNGVADSRGMTLNIIPYDTPCFRCAFPEMPLPGSIPTCETAGVLNTITGTISNISSTEAIKILLKSDKVRKSLYCIDVWEGSTEYIAFPRDSQCPTCEQHSYELLEAPVITGSTSLCGRNAIQVRPTQKGIILDLPKLAKRLCLVGKAYYNEHLIRFYLEGYEFTIFTDARAIIKGTDEENIARSLYARYIGV